MRLRLTESQLRVLTKRILLEVKPLKWTEDKIRQEASKYNSKIEFYKGSQSAYQAALRQRMLDDLFPSNNIFGPASSLSIYEHIRKVLKKILIS